ncbi:MAG: SRPBCC family protein [Acetobacteraceae bacterium]
MTRGPEAIQGDSTLRPAPLRLSRVFHARRATVFRAWSTAEHVKRWFSPEIFTVPAATVRLQVGGPFEVCMRTPAGEEHWIRGIFAEVTPDSRLVIDMECGDGEGRILFHAHTEVDFADVPGGTRMDVVQSYTIVDPAMAWMVAGAPDGWRSTLDKLATEVARMQVGSPGDVRSVVHAIFHLERTYDAPAPRVWRALTDMAAKQKWFAGPPGEWDLLERHMDVRVGGTERAKGRWKGGVVSTFEAIYHDVIPNERLVYSYVMHLDDRKISVSLATMQLAAAGDRTTLRVTEQSAFLDGYDDAGSREHGTGYLLDALGASLAD